MNREADSQNFPFIIWNVISNFSKIKFKFMRYFAFLFSGHETNDKLKSNSELPICRRLPMTYNMMMMNHFIEIMFLSTNRLRLA